MKTKEEILLEMDEIMPFKLSSNVKPYLLEAMEVYSKSVVNNLAIQRVFTWLPWKKENYDKFNELCKKDRCICLFDDGTECNYNNEHPMAIMTHFREEKELSCQTNR